MNSNLKSAKETLDKLFASLERMEQTHREAVKNAIRAKEIMAELDESIAAFDRELDG